MQRSSVWYNSRYLLKNVWLCKNSFRKPSNQKHKTNQNSWKPRQLLQKTDNRYSPNEILKGLISHVHVGKDCKKIIHIARQFIATYLLRNLVLRFHHHSSLELKYKISFTARGILKVNWQILKDSVWHFVSHIHTYIYDSNSRQFEEKYFWGDYCCCSCCFLNDMQRTNHKHRINLCFAENVRNPTEQIHIFP